MARPKKTLAEDIADFKKTQAETVGTETVEYTPKINSTLDVKVAIKPKPQGKYKVVNIHDYILQCKDVEFGSTRVIEALETMFNDNGEYVAQIERRGEVYFIFKIKE